MEGLSRRKFDFLLPELPLFDIMYEVKYRFQDVSNKRDKAALHFGLYIEFCSGRMENTSGEQLLPTLMRHPNPLA